MSRVFPRRVAVTAILLAAVLGGCGGGDGGGAEDASAEIAKTLEAGLATDDPVVLCRQTLSTAFATRVYGSVERCLAVEGQARASRSAATAVDVSRVVVDGDRGTAVAALRGGDQGGATGPVTVVREEGGWRLEDLSTEFLRSEFNAGVASDPELDDGLTTCVGKKVVALGDEELRALAFGSMGGRAEAQLQLRGLVTACLKELDAPSAGDAA